MDLHPREPATRRSLYRRHQQPRLGQRVYAHRTGTGSIHAARYRIWRLVYTESFNDVREAIAREKQLKKWRRQWKIDLIERHNPTWEDLYPHTIT